MTIPTKEVHSVRATASASGWLGFRGRPTENPEHFGKFPIARNTKMLPKGLSKRAPKRFFASPNMGFSPRCEKLLSPLPPQASIVQ